MKLKKTIMLLLLFTVSLHPLIAQKKPATIYVQDFKRIVGCWQGTLTYLDYTTGKPFSMSADLNITQVGKSDKFIFSNIYPKEPQANSVDTVIVSTANREINNETIQSIIQKANGVLEMITEVSGVDGNDNKPAILRYTYTLGKLVYIHRKEVQFIGQTEWIKRHEYKYNIKPCS